jgi:hypothetical protein
MENISPDKNSASTALLVIAFLAFLAIIWKFTDLFTSILGTIIMVAVFAIDYNIRKGHTH